jgi:hypothetical protein
MLVHVVAYFAERDVLAHPVLGKFFLPHFFTILFFLCLSHQPQPNILHTATMPTDTPHPSPTMPSVGTVLACEVARLPQRYTGAFNAFSCGICKRCPLRCTVCLKCYLTCTCRRNALTEADEVSQDGFCSRLDAQLCLDFSKMVVARNPFKRTKMRMIKEEKEEEVAFCSLD